MEGQRRVEDVYKSHENGVGILEKDGREIQELEAREAWRRTMGLHELPSTPHG